MTCVKRWEAADFGALTAAGGYAEKYAKNVSRWLEKTWVTPEHCFVFGNVGGVCFAADGDDLEILDFAVNDDRITDGAEFLRQALELGAKGRNVAYNLYDDTTQYKMIKAIFAECGFSIKQEKLCFTYETANVIEASAAGLPLPREITYKSIDEVGDDAFVEAVRMVTVGTLDGLMAKEADAKGGTTAAREYVESLKELDCKEGWWRLAYERSELVGLIIPQAFSEDTGAINYIGVVPERRGEGIGQILLTEGTRTLVDFGIKKIYADIDKANTPLAHQLENVGYKLKCEEVVLERLSQIWGNFLPGYSVKPITRENYAQAADVFFSNEAFFMENEGKYLPTARPLLHS